MRHAKIIVSLAVSLYVFVSCKGQNSGGQARAPGSRNGAATVNCNVPNPPASCGDSSSNTYPSSSSTSTTGSAAMNCSIATSATVCPTIAGCTWNGMSCVASGATTGLPTGATTGLPSGVTTGIATGTTTAAPSGFCTSLSQPKCAAAPSCEWNGTSCVLTGMAAAPQPTSCTELSTLDECRADPACFWTGSACSRPSVGLGKTFEVGNGLSNVGTASVPTLNCNFSLIFQADGNLVIFQGKKEIWKSNTASKGVNYFGFEYNGNAILKNTKIADVNKQILWNTNTAGKLANWLLLSRAGNLAVLNASQTILWDTKTTVSGCY